MGISPYLRRLREAIGHELVLVPSVAVLAWDEDGRLLLVRDAVRASEERSSRAAVSRDRGAQ